MVQAMAKNIIANSVVTVEVVKDYGSKCKEVRYDGSMFVVQNKDLTIIEEPTLLDKRTNAVVKLLESCDLSPSLCGGDDHEVITAHHEWKDEIITVTVYDKHYEVDTAKYVNKEVGNAKNARRIVKYDTLVKWLENRIG